ncbi:MAG: glycosyltransferase, partial [Gemmatimonadales bacterium]
MRIVCVTHAYPRFDGDVAGAFVERLVLALARRGHTMAVVAPADQGRGGRELRHGVIVERVRYAPASWETLAYRGTMAEAVRSPLGVAAFASLVLRLARRAAVLAQAMSADLVHAHWWVPGGLGAWLLRRLGGPPYAVTLHGTDVAVLEYSGPGRTLARRVLRGAGAVTAVSSFLADRAAHLAGVDRHRITVCPMPADTGRLGQAGRGGWGGRGGGGIMTLGRLTTQKRLDVLLGAVVRLRRAGRSRPLTVLGDGPA